MVHKITKSQIKKDYLFESPYAELKNLEYNGKPYVLISIPQGNFLLSKSVVDKARGRLKTGKINPKEVYHSYGKGKNEVLLTSRENTESYNKFIYFYGNHPTFARKVDKLFGTLTPVMFGGKF
jgi:hypothetical protein